MPNIDSIRSEIERMRAGGPAVQGDPSAPARRHCHRISQSPARAHASQNRESLRPALRFEEASAGPKVLGGRRW